MSRETSRVMAASLALGVLVLILTALSYVYAESRLREAAIRAVAAEARAVAEKDRELFSLVLALDAVYAPVSLLPVNPYLPEADREILLGDGGRLSRLSPGNVVRLMHERLRDPVAGPNGHLASLAPLRPQNFADAWEAQALTALKVENLPEYVGLDEIDGQETVRVMTPLRMEQACLGCHGTQGYRPGEVGGGVSASYPLKPALAAYAGLQRGILGAHLGFAGLGLLGVGWYSRSRRRSLAARTETEATLGAAVANLENRLSQTARALEKSESRNRRVLNSAIEGMIAIDTDGAITAVNATALEMLRYADQSELVGRPMHETLHHANYDGTPNRRRDCPLCTARASSSHARFKDETFCRKDGSWVFISGSIAPVTENDLVTGAIVFFHDASELCDLEALQKMVFANSQEPFFICDGELRIKECNEAAVRYLGAESREELLAHYPKYLPFFDENAAGGRREEIREACDQEAFARFTWPVRHASGRWMPCELSATRIAYQHFNGYFCSLHDLRAIKEYENLLTRERKLLRDIIDASPAAMFIFDQDQRVRRTNPAARSLSGISDGDDMAPAWVRPEEWERLAEAVKSGETVHNAPLRFYGCDGRPLDALAGLSRVLYDGEPQAWLLWLQNVTDLVAAREEALESTRAKSDFLARMSHEIRTPMNAILGMTYLLLQTETSDVQRHYVERAQKAARNLLGLINDILDFSKIEAGKLSLEHAPFYLPEVLDNLGDLLSLAASEKNLELLFHTSADVPEHLVGDALRLSQVLINLANNALKFTERGEVVVRVRVLERREGSVLLEVSVNDTGIGMSEEQLALLFEPFHQVDDSITRKYGGTGLGLAICARLVHMMGGEIRVESQPDRGSRFIFTARFALDGEAGEVGEAGRDGHGAYEGHPGARGDAFPGVRPYPSPGVPEAARPEVPAAAREIDRAEDSDRDEFFHNERMLIVDDNPAAREILADMLTDLRCRVDKAETGFTAVNMVREAMGNDPYALVLLDWRMPGMDGLACARAIRALSDGGAVAPQLLMVSAFGLEEYRREGQACGIVDYVAKPASRATLARAMHKALGRQTADAPALAAEAAFESDLRNIRGAHVLLVEDNEINQEVAVSLLRHYGFEVSVASNGVEAVQACKARNYDLVFMDIQMPVMDGLEACRRIRNIAGKGERELPIVAMTAHAMASDKDRSLKAGMNDYLSKPFEPAELVKIMARWIRPRAGRMLASGTPGGWARDPGAPVPLSFSLPGVDMESALRFVGGKSSSLFRQLRRFADEYRLWPDKLWEAVQAGNLDEATRYAHTLRGMAATLGAQGVALCAAEVEECCGDNEECRAALERLRTQLALVCDGVDAALSGPEGA